MRASAIDYDRFVDDRLPPPGAWPDRPLDGLPPSLKADRLNAGAALLDRLSDAATAGRVAYRGDLEEAGYDRVARRAETAAGALAAAGLVPGNRVLLTLPNGPDLAAALVGCWLAGGVAVPTPPLLRPAELARALGLTRAGFAIVDPGIEAGLAEAAALSGVAPRRVEPGTASGPCRPVDTAAEAPALILFTSGTTGLPKTAVHDHRAVLATAHLFAADLLHPTPEDVFVGTPPFAFAYGFAGLFLFPLMAGAATVLPTRHGVDGLAEAMARHRTTICVTAPTAYRRMAPILDREALAGLRVALSAGEPLSPSVAERWAGCAGAPPIDVLGTTELLSMVLTADAGREGLRPVRGIEARLVDAAGRPMAAGADGRLAVRGPTGCRYLDAPDAQAGYVVDGWNVTGDMMRALPDGRLVCLGRADDLILTAGYTVSGAEVEAVLIEHPAVRDCAVFGTRDPERGQVIAALVVPDSSFVADETMIRDLQDYVKARIAPWKYPRAIAFVETLPRTATGKLRRRDLPRLPR